MLERDVPNRECFELGIASLDTTLVFMINLGKADRHFSTSRTRRSHHHKFTRGFNELILSITVVAHDERNVARVTRNRIMAIDLETKRFEFFLVSDSTRLFLPTRQHHAAHVESVTAESVNQAEHVLIVGNSKVATDFILFDVACVDCNDDFGLVLDFFEHADL